MSTRISQIKYSNYFFRQKFADIFPHKEKLFLNFFQRLRILKELKMYMELNTLK